MAVGFRPSLTRVESKPPFMKPDKTLQDPHINMELYSVSKASASEETFPRFVHLHAASLRVHRNTAQPLHDPCTNSSFLEGPLNSSDHTDC